MPDFNNNEGIRVFVQPHHSFPGIWVISVYIPLNIDFKLPGINKYSFEGQMTIDGIIYKRYENTTFYNERNSAYQVAKNILI
jgi:hypothetical protein